MTTEKHPREQPGVWLPAIRTGTGADVFTLRLSEALERRGLRTSIGWLPSFAEYLPWFVHPPTPPGWADLVHANSTIHPRLLPSGLPLVATIHLCVHDPGLLSHKTPLQRLYHHYWIRHCESATLRRASAVTAVSRYTAQRSSTVFSRAEIKTIHNWIDLNEFSPDNRTRSNRPFKLLFVGKLSRRKGADLLVRIMTELDPDFQLQYTGTREELRRYGPLSDNVVPLGRLTSTGELVEAYRACDALLFPTRLEGFGYVALEAQACGRPVIATATSSIPEVVQHDRTGILCPVDDVAALAAAARRLRDSPETWLEMAQAARLNAVRHFGENEMIASYLSTYATLAP